MLDPRQKIAARAELPEASGKQPLAAAIWGLNLEIVKLLLQHLQERGIQPMSLDECKKHNISRYKQMFILSELSEWKAMIDVDKIKPDERFEFKVDDVFEIEISKSPFLRSQFLAALGVSAGWFSDLNHPRAWLNYLNQKRLIARGAQPGSRIRLWPAKLSLSFQENVNKITQTVQTGIYTSGSQSYR